MKRGTKTLLFGTKQIFIRPIFVIIAWIRLYSWKWDIRALIAIIIQFMGLFGKEINEKSELSRIEWAENFMNKFDKKRKVRILYSGKDLEQTLMIMPTDYNVKKIREDSENNSTEVTIIKRESQWKNMITGSAKKRAKEKMIPYSELYLSNKESIRIMPLWMLMILTTLSGDPEGYKEMKMRK